MEPDDDAELISSPESVNLAALIVGIAWAALPWALGWYGLDAFLHAVLGLTLIAYVWLRVLYGRLDMKYMALLTFMAGKVKPAVRCAGCGAATTTEMVDPAHALLPDGWHVEEGELFCPDCTDA